MKKLLFILILGSLFAQDLPCEDETYLELKKKKLDKMSDREYEYFTRKDTECSAYLSKNIKSQKNLSKNIKSQKNGYLYIGPSIGMFGGMDLGYGTNQFGRIYFNSQLAYDWSWSEMWYWVIVMYEKPIYLSDKIALTPSFGIGTSVVGGLNFEIQTNDFLHLKLGAKQGLDIISGWGEAPLCVTMTFGFTI